MQGHPAICPVILCRDVKTHAGAEIQTAVPIDILRHQGKHTGLFVLVSLEYAAELAEAVPDIGHHPVIPVINLAQGAVKAELG